MTDVLDLFHGNELVKVCAPMVRYSKLPFRTLVRKYDCDLCFTPMILADSFLMSAKSRAVEFSTNEGDSPLVVQFAANNSSDFVAAAEIVAPFSNGVDLNCGCPQRWAMKEGYGADLLTKPHLVKEMVLQVRNQIPKPFSVSVKIRIDDDLRKTVKLCQSLEAAGVSFLTVHARTPQQRHTPINTDALRELRDSLQLPLIANGDVKTLKGAQELKEITGCQGIMAARGILTNPAMFAGHSKTPVECIQSWVNIATHTGVSFKCFHHHLVFMLEKVLPKVERNKLNSMRSADDVYKFLGDYFGIFVDVSAEDWMGGGIIGCDNEEEDQGSYFKERVMKIEIPTDDHLDGAFNLFNGI